MARTKVKTGRPRKERERNAVKVAYRLDRHFNRAAKARELGISVDTVMRAVAEVKAKPLISEEERLEQLLDLRFLGHEAQAQRYAKLALKAHELEDAQDPQEVHRIVRDLVAMAGSLGLDAPDRQVIDQRIEIVVSDE